MRRTGCIMGVITLLKLQTVSYVAFGRLLSQDAQRYIERDDIESDVTPGPDELIRKDAIGSMAFSRYG